MLLFLPRVTSFISCKWLSCFLMNYCLMCSAALSFASWFSPPAVMLERYSGEITTLLFWSISFQTENTVTLAISRDYVCTEMTFIKDALSLTLKTSLWGWRFPGADNRACFHLQWNAVLFFCFFCQNLVFKLQTSISTYRYKTKVQAESFKIYIYMCVCIHTSHTHTYIYIS